MNDTPKAAPPPGKDAEMGTPEKDRSLVNTAQFAGRLGGNQAFIVDQHDDEAAQLLAKQPDAAPLVTAASSLSLHGFLSADLWRVAFLEGWGTFLLVGLLGALASGLTASDQSLFAQNLFGALSSFIALGLFTFCLGPVSGAHLNPTITLATFFTGLSTLPRTVLYISAQCIGAIVAGYWLRLGLDEDYFPHGVIPGCTVDPLTVSRGQLFVLEFLFCQAMVFIAFGLGLDPRQNKVLGPAFAPVLIGVSLALGLMCSGLLKPGYTGMSFNPARCLGLMTAKNEMQYHYIHWLAPLTATVLNGLFYQLAPPWTRQVSLLTALGVQHRGRR